MNTSLSGPVRLNSIHSSQGYFIIPINPRSAWLSRCSYSSKYHESPWDLFWALFLLCLGVSCDVRLYLNVYSLSSRNTWFIYISAHFFLSWNVSRKYCFVRIKLSSTPKEWEIFQQLNALTCNSAMSQNQAMNVQLWNHFWWKREAKNCHFNIFTSLYAETIDWEIILYLWGQWIKDSPSQVDWI